MKPTRTLPHTTGTGIPPLPGSWRPASLADLIACVREVRKVTAVRLCLTSLTTSL